MHKIFRIEMPLVENTVTTLRTLICWNTEMSELQAEVINEVHAALTRTNPIHRHLDIPTA